jgi:hypothetical protein
VLALGAHHRGRALAVHLHPIGAVIDPASVGMAHDHHVAGADIVAAVVFVPFRRRDFCEVDLVAAINILQNQPGRHRDRRNRLVLLHVFPPERDQVHVGGVRRQAKRHLDALGRGENVGKRAISARIARNIVEQDRLVADLALVEVDNAADLVLTVGASDHLQVVGCLQFGKPGAQVLLGRIGERLGGKVGRMVHGEPFLKMRPPRPLRGPKRAASWHARGRADNRRLC